MIIFFSFFSKKSRETTSGERVKGKKARTPPPPPHLNMTGMSPQARSVGLSNTMLQRQPTVKQSQV